MGEKRVFSVKAKVEVPVVARPTVFHGKQDSVILADLNKGERLVYPTSYRRLPKKEVVR